MSLPNRRLREHIPNSSELSMWRRPGNENVAPGQHMMPFSNLVRSGSMTRCGMIGGTMETSASFEARSAPSSYPTEPHRPRVKRRNPRGTRRSVDRGAHRPAIEPRKRHHFGCRRSSLCGRRNGGVRQSRVPRRPGVVGDPGMCVRFLCGTREISRSTNSPSEWRAALVRVGKARSRSR